MYHAGWAWAGSTPFQATKLVASYFGGTRNPLVVSWPARSRLTSAPRTQFHHVNDIAPTIYEVLGITPPREVNGEPQDPIDGISMEYSFNDAGRQGPEDGTVFREQWQPCALQGWLDRLGVRPLHSLAGGTPRAAIAKWDSDADHGRSMISSKDFSQADDVSASGPERVAAMKSAFPRGGQGQQGVSRSAQATGCACTRRIASRRPIRAGTLTPTRSRMPEFTAPGLGRESSIVTIDAEFGENASGVLYALGGASGGLTLYMDKVTSFTTTT